MEVANLTEYLVECERMAKDNAAKYHKVDDEQHFYWFGVSVAYGEMLRALDNAVPVKIENHGAVN